MKPATDLIKEMTAVLRRAGWTCAVVYWDRTDGTFGAELLRTEEGRTERVVWGEGLDMESADQDLLRNWAAGKGTAPAASSPEELELKIAALDLYRRAACIF